MSSPEEKFRIWDAYWSSDRLYSFGADQDPNFSQTLDRYWSGVVRRLGSGASVLDVACGNGAVGQMMVRTAQALGNQVSITGIDEAAIDPPTHLPQHADVLKEITFRPHTTMEALPFQNATFDAVVSQYGFEFGNLPKALNEAARVLKPNGIMTCLALPATSTPAIAAKKTVKQARFLLRDAVLFNEAFRIIQHFHEGDPATRDDRMRAELEVFNREVERTVGQFDASESDVVFAIIMGLNKVFIDRKSKGGEEQMMEIETVRTGLAQYAARAQATTKAALNDANLETLKRLIASSGLKLTETRTLMIGNATTIAWQLTAQRLPL